MAAPPQSPESTRSFDAIIIGAGISGLNGAYRLKSQLPGATFTLLEGRDSFGGTWDLFRYPGVRSDSDLYSYGFGWRPRGVAEHIRFRHQVTAAHWSSKSQRWHLKVDHEGESQHFQARFIIMGTGYYDYKSPMKAVIPGIENFQGEVIHPQFWPTNYDYSGKRLAIIGSGATAITLLPEIAKEAAHVTMVQRSPSYIFSTSNSGRNSQWLRKYLPLSLAGAIERIRGMMYIYMMVSYCHYFPQNARELMRKLAIEQLPDWIDYDTHFSPKYTPWQQRLCITPDGDFYKALHNRKADVVTGRIDTVTGGSIRMEDGTAVDADVIITATGLNVQMGGNIDLQVDGKAVAWGEKLMWNGTMIEDVPNLAYMLGYSNASWTLGADNGIWVFIRLMKFMGRKRLQTATPRAPKEARAETSPWFRLTSNYLKHFKAVLSIRFIIAHVVILFIIIGLKAQHYRESKLFLVYLRRNHNAAYSQPRFWLLVKEEIRDLGYLTLGVLLHILPLIGVKELHNLQSTRNIAGV
ncbi:hypothetical protein SLS62_005393 [Diatrype stigma]|uniref:Uncharacterized protein n=1 Tax=Diatrype stigma TaxID=117547 RepID=A0AAN9V0L6_9PEZI